MLAYNMYPATSYGWYVRLPGLQGCEEVSVDFNSDHNILSAAANSTLGKFFMLADTKLEKRGGRGGKEEEKDTDKGGNTKKTTISTGMLSLWTLSSHS
jgi:hypothetical protein